MELPPIPAPPSHKTRTGNHRKPARHFHRKPPRIHFMDEPKGYFGRIFSLAKYADARFRISFSISNTRVFRRRSMSSCFSALVSTSTRPGSTAPMRKEPTRSAKSHSTDEAPGFLPQTANLHMLRLGEPGTHPRINLPSTHPPPQRFTTPPIRGSTDWITAHSVSDFCLGSTTKRTARPRKSLGYCFGTVPFSNEYRN